MPEKPSLDIRSITGYRMSVHDPEAPLPEHLYLGKPFQVCDVPRWDALPPREVLASSFRLDAMRPNYAEGRPMDTFASNHRERDGGEARILTLGNIIGLYNADQARFGLMEADELEPDMLTKLFRTLRVRPACLEELLAFSRDQWNPKDSYHEIVRAAGTTFIDNRCMYSPVLEYEPALMVSERSRGYVEGKRTVRRPARRILTMIGAHARAGSETSFLVFPE